MSKNVVWLVAGVAALGLGIVFLLFAPRPGRETPSGRALILRWGHGLVWLFLAAAALAASANFAAPAAVLALAGGLMYALFVVALFKSRDVQPVEGEGEGGDEGAP